MRALRVLLTVFGLVVGLLVCAVVVLIDWVSSEPVRTNFAYVGGGDAEIGAVSVAVDPRTIYVIAAVSLLGAFVGWLVGLIATGHGWRISRND